MREGLDPFEEVQTWWTGQGGRTEPESDYEVAVRNVRSALGLDAGPYTSARANVVWNKPIHLHRNKTGKVMNKKTSGLV